MSSIPVLDRDKTAILVVDDSEANLIAMQAALAPLGRELVLARSGSEALKRLLEQDVALILLDVAMPGMDGFETARLIRSRERNRSTPILFVTGSDWSETAVLRAYEFGAFDFLIKPIRPKMLRAKAQVFLDLHERTLQLQQAQARVYEHELEAQRQKFEARELESKLRQLAETDRRKGQLLAILSHELRNPLQPLQIVFDLMREHPDDPIPLRTRAILERQLRRVGRLVDDLLDIARFSTGTLELQPSTVDLADVIEEAVAAIQPVMEARHHQVTITTDQTLESVILRVDRDRLVQAVGNLLKNASMSTADGGTIEIGWEVRGDEAFVRVTDNGRGIEPELLPMVFDMLVPERVGLNGSGGLGLDLALVKQIIELHGGRVRATSAGIGTGSTFEIAIPRARVEPFASSLGTGEPRAESKSEPLRIVVCDDSPDILELLGTMLTGYGHHVTTVSDGRSAVAAIVSETPDVALIDIGLPDIDGYEVAREVHRVLPDDAPRLIAITGYGQPGDRDAALAAGFDAHIVKPASATKIVAALHSPAQAS